MKLSLDLTTFGTRLDIDDMAALGAFGMFFSAVFRGTNGDDGRWPYQARSTLSTGDAEALISIKYGRLLAPQQLRQLGDVGGDAPGLVAVSYSPAAGR
jgi:hypothetical protein